MSSISSLRCGKMRALYSVAAVLLMSAVAILPLVGSGEGKWQDQSEPIVVQSDMLTGGQWTYNISVPRNSEVSRAVMTVEGDPYTMDAGTEYSTIHLPENPSVDINGDGTTDWTFPGTMGMQDVFTSNNTQQDLKYDAPGQTRSLDFRLPRSTITEAALSINNTLDTKYSYTMSLGDSVVWNKDSLSFSYSNASTTAGSVTYVTTADINGDGWADLIGCGPNGKIFICVNLRGRFVPAGVIDISSSIDSASKNLYMIAAGVLTDSMKTDLAVACADGNIYYLTNSGGGIFGGAARIESGTSQAMTSVTIADVDGDGIPDIVGGNLNGKFYVFYNSGGASFDTGDPANVRVLNAGSGTMNAVTVADINEDSFPDLVGANSDKNLYLALSLGSRDFDNTRPVVAGAQNGLTSIDAVDIDHDLDYDLVTSSRDGNVYICLNLGGAQGFNPGDFGTAPGEVPKVYCENPVSGLLTAIVTDVNGDGWWDIVALGNSKQVYLVLNDGTGASPFFATSGSKLFQAGQSAKSLAATPLTGQLGKRIEPDIAVANGNRIDLWDNNQGPFNDVLHGPSFIAALQSYVSAAPGVPDDWGNPMVTLHFTVNNRYTGQLRFAELLVNYTYDAQVDFTSALSDIMNASTGPGDAPVIVPVVFKMDGAGILTVSGLTIDSQIGLVALIDFPAEGSTLYSGRSYTLQGHANYDLTGELFNYTWTDIVSGRLLGYEPSRPFIPTAIENMTLQLRVDDTLHGKESNTVVHVSVVEEPAAALNVSKLVLSPSKPKEGDSVSLKVTVKNTGRINATNVGFQVYLDKVKGNPVASGTIDRVDVARTGTAEIFWQASDPGSHKLIFRIVSADQKITVGPDYTAPIEVQRTGIVDIVPIVAAIIVIFVAVGVVAVLVKRRRDTVQAREDKGELEQAAQSQTGQLKVDDMTSSLEMSPAPQSQDLYAADRSGQSEALYTAAAEAASPTRKRFTCPRCGKTTEEEGLLCLECNAKDSIAGACTAVAEADEMALEVEHPQELIKKAEAAFAAGNFADSIEAATEAEDEARSTKERFEECSDFATGKKKGIEIDEDIKPSGPKLGAALKVGDEAPRPTSKPMITSSSGPVLRPSLKLEDTGRTEAQASGPVVTLKPPKCPSCGKDVQPRWKICPNCQAKLG